MKPRQFHYYEDLFAMPGLGSAFRTHAKELYRNDCGSCLFVVFISCLTRLIWS
jgi:hypothetical protein